MHCAVVESFSSWRFRSNFFWTKVFYALLAVPFLPFALPGVATLLTHACATGYDRKGRCVPTQRKKKKDGKNANKVLPREILAPRS